MKNSSLILLLAFMMTFVALTISPAFSSAVIKMDFDQIVSQADMIISGKITDIQAKRELNPRTGKNSIYTYITVETEDVYRGKVKDGSYTFRLLGGVMPGESIGEMVSGSPVFRMNQEVFLFLKDDKTLYSPVVGLNQGRFNLKTDSKTGMKQVFDNYNRPVTSGFIFGDKTITSKEAVTYEQFKAQVENRLK